MYNKEKFVIDFINRTEKNIEIINKSSGGLNFTQLINSLLGLIILPEGKIFSSNITISEKDNEELNKLCIDLNSMIVDRYTKKVKDNPKMLIKHIRNSLAHCASRLKFSEKNGKIYSVIFCDEKSDRQYFKVEMNKEQILQLINIVKNICIKYYSTKK